MQPDELIKEIYTIVHTLREQDMGSLSGDTLSRLVVKLASYKASLGEIVSSAKRDALDAEAIYQEMRAKAYAKLRDAGKGSTDSDELKRKDEKVVDSLAVLNKEKYDADRVTQLSLDCHDLIDAIKSRLIHLQTERSEADVY
jgi:hypothetical protein